MFMLGICSNPTVVSQSINYNHLRDSVSRIGVGAGGGGGVNRVTRSVAMGPDWDQCC